MKKSIFFILILLMILGYNCDYDYFPGVGDKFPEITNVCFSPNPVKRGEELTITYDSFPVDIETIDDITIDTSGSLVYIGSQYSPSGFDFSNFIAIGENPITYYTYYKAVEVKDVTIDFYARFTIRCYIPLKSVTSHVHLSNNGMDYITTEILIIVDASGDPIY